MTNKYFTTETTMIMTNEEIKTVNEEIATLREKYFNLLDSFKYEEADKIHNMICRLNNSIH